MQTWSDAKRKRSEVGTCCAERVIPPYPERMVSSTVNAKHVACNETCGGAAADLHCCRVSGVASRASQSQSYSEGSTAGQPKEHLNRCKAWSRRWTSRRRTCSAIYNSRTSAWPTALKLQVVPTTLPMHAGRAHGSLKQDSRCRLIWPHREPATWIRQGDAEAPDPTAVVSWSEEQLLELAMSLPAMR